MLVTPDIACSVCDNVCEKIFSANGNFILKGDDWPSHNFRMKGEMTKKNTDLKSKMVERERSGEGITKMADIKN